MIDLTAFALLRPWWLLALPGVAVLALFGVRRATALSGWHRAVEPKLLTALGKRGGVVPGVGDKGMAATLAAATMALALTGPAVQRADTTAFRNLDGLVVATDLSRSVTAGGQLSQIRFMTQAIIESAGSRQVALIVFAGDAYVASPFTTDRNALGATVFALEPDIVPVAGSRPARALRLTRRMLEDSGMLRADVVVISDGGGVDAATLAEAVSITATGHSVHTVLVSSAQSPGDASLGDGALLAALAGGQGAINAALDDPGQLLAHVGGRLSARLGRTDLAVLAWRDFGRLLLLLALAPALTMFRRVA